MPRHISSLGGRRSVSLMVTWELLRKGLLCVRLVVRCVSQLASLELPLSRSASWPSGLLNQDGAVVGCREGDGGHVSRGRLNYGQNPPKIHIQAGFGSAPGDGERRRIDFSQFPIILLFFCRLIQFALYRQFTIQFIITAAANYNASCRTKLD